MECLSVICSLHVLSISQFYRNQDITVWNNINKPRSNYVKMMKSPSCSRFSVTISCASCQDALTFLLCRLMRKSGLSMWKWMYCLPIYIHQLGTGVLRGILGVYLIYSCILMIQNTYILYVVVFFWYLPHFELTPSVYLVSLTVVLGGHVSARLLRMDSGDTMVALVLLVFFYWFFRYNE